MDHILLSPIRPLTKVPRDLLVAITLLLPLCQLAFADPSVVPAAGYVNEGEVQGNDVNNKGDDVSAYANGYKALEDRNPLRAEAVKTTRTAAAELIAEATELIGVKYKYGGRTPKTGFDCSGFVHHVFIKAVGVSLPRNASQMSLVGQKIAHQQLQPGDLVFYNTRKRAFSHVGIYVGDGKFIHSPKKGSVVKFADMKNRYWRKRFQGARRVAVFDHASPTSAQIMEDVRSNASPGVSS